MRERLAVVASGVGGLSVLSATQPILDALATDLDASTSAAAWTIAGSTLGVALTIVLALSAPVAALAWRGTSAPSGSRIVDPGP